MSKAALRQCLTILLCALVLSSCGTTLRKKNLEVLDQLARYSGVVQHEASPERLTIVLLLHTADHSMAAYVVADPRGTFDIIHPPGDYRLLAFVDLDANFQWDQGEPWAMSNSSAIDTSSQPDHEGINIITIGNNTGDIPPIDVDLTLQELPSATEIRTAAMGRVVSIDDPMLGPETGLQSLWQPIEFLKNKNAGVFLLEPFDATRIPVILINGIGGSPSELRKIAERLDKDRFQPVFLTYPSGLSVELNGWLLQRLAVEIRARRQDLGDSIVIAHSMGGLVARSMINRMVHAESHYPIAFISISTPWLGHESSSERGARIVGVPVWADLVPGSSFLSSIFDTPLPEDLHYYLLFSYSGESAMVKGSDDGTVTIPSMLAYEAQDQARQVRGLAESHTSILESDRAISFILDILDEEAKRARQPASR